MSRVTFIFMSLALLVGGNVRLMAFALIGPYESWQTTVIAYQLGGDLGGPMNIGNEYRRNTPNMYYSVDEEFINFFGSDGIRAITNAYEVLNQLARTNLSDYSSNLVEFPLDSTQVDPVASALTLFDLKSLILSAMMEQLGLAQPMRFTWCIRTRYVDTDLEDIECPGNVIYTVIQRNFAISPTALDTPIYSTEINGVSYDEYTIFEGCDGPDPKADAVEIGPLTSALAELNIGYGTFVDNLTRDDVAGLRYLMSSNNVNPETTGNNAFGLVTNSTPALFYPSNFTTLASAAAINNAPTLMALFPGLDVTSSTNYFVQVAVPNYTAYFTNSPYAPVGSLPQLVVETNYTTNVEARYVHTFGNVTNFDYRPYTIQSLLITNIAPSPYGPVGSGVSVTNVTVQTFVNTNVASGSYLILPSNVCALDIVSTALTQVVRTTNLLFFTSTTITNTAGFSQYEEYSQSIVTAWTNHILVGRAVNCTEDVAALRGGIEAIHFYRRDYDSLLGQFFAPFTNVYQHRIIQNNQARMQTVERVVTQPDFLLTADDTVNDTPRPYIWPALMRNLNFTTGPTSGAGPGLIDPSTRFTLNSVGLGFSGGPSFDTNVFLTQDDFFPIFLYGSFDGTTNGPIIYPNGTSIQEVENHLLMQIVTPTLPNGTVGQPYDSGALSGQGGVPPYLWTLPPFVAAPPGLSAPNPVSGNITGIPTTPGIYHFSVRMTDSTGRYVDRTFTLAVNPS